MPALGQAKLVGLDYPLETGSFSFLEQIEKGLRRDGPLERLRYLARSNYAYNYIWWLRTRSNDPAYLERVGEIERRWHRPFRRPRSLTARAEEFKQLDYHFASQMVDRELVSAFADDLQQPQLYHDVYDPGFTHNGSPDHCRHPFLMMDPHALFRNPNFLKLCATPDLIAFCREVLGPDAALSWAWSWISQPREQAYQNQNWHRDSAEPLNMIRLFIPLGSIESLDDGPTEFIPATSNLRAFFEVRRYQDAELAELKARNGAGTFFAEPGDVYFLNTFALHRGNPPRRRRAVLSLLVSLEPSWRTPSVAKLDRKMLPEDVRDAIGGNRRFFRHFVR